MADALHFLSRLERLARPEVELALGLYRQAALVRAILAVVRLPEGAERVALSLGDPVAGPFVVVTRDGDFVTCLAEGMSVGSLPVVPRERLESHRERLLAQRERVVEANAWLTARGGLGSAFRDIWRLGPDVTREHMVALSAMGPLLAKDLWNWFAEATAHAGNLRNALLARYRHLDPPRGPDAERLRLFWDCQWGAAHLLALSAEHTDAASLAELLSQSASPPPSWHLVRYGHLGHVVRAVYSLGRFGKPMLALYKTLLGKAVSATMVWAAGLGLAAIGLRHARLATEARKALSSPYTDPRMEEARRTSLLVLDTEAQRPLLAAQLLFGARVVQKAIDDAPPDHWLHGVGLDDVEESVLRAAALVAPINLFGARIETEAIIPSLPWVAKASLPDLYLPQRWVTALRFPYDPEDPLRLLAIMRKDRALGRPVRVKAPPGRNERCPCGSGRKYKVCCAATAGA